MRNIKNIIIATGIVSILASCSVTVPYAVTDNKGTKMGSAKEKLFLNIGSANVGTATAAKNGGITKVATVDYRIKNGLFFTTYETIVTGE